MEKLDAINWGISSIDKATGGLPKGQFSIIETPGYLSGNIFLGAFVMDGLKKGEKCTLVTHDSPESFLSGFSNWDFDFNSYLESEKLIFLNYNPTISYETGLTFDYMNIFEEIHFMSGDLPDRIVFQQLDAMLNLNSQALINASIQKLKAVGKSDTFENTTLLGQFIHFGDDTHNRLSIGLQKTMDAYFSLTRVDALNPYEVRFMTNKLPWYGYNQKPSLMRLAQGEGFVDAEPVG